MESDSLYEILGVPQDADAELIRAAYRKIAMKCHPDRTNNDPAATQRFRLVTEAFKTLTDPVRRAAHDRRFEPVRSVEQLFREHEIGRRVVFEATPSAPAEPRRGADACVLVLRSRLMKARGGILPLKIEGDVVQTRIPLEVQADLADVRLCTLAHLGSPGRNGGENGDLLIVILEEGE